MPTKTIKKRTASKTRSRTVRRKGQPVKRCKRSKSAKPHSPKVIANSIFALTLTAKPGFEVLAINDGKRSALSGDDNYQEMYDQLLKCFHHGIKLATGSPTKYDPLRMLDMPLGSAFGALINAFENQVLPQGYDFRIDKNHLGYHFTIFKYAPFNEYWHAFEIKPVINYLTKRRDKRLLNLFIKFIAAFKNETQIMTWYNGGCGFSEYMMYEELIDWEENWGPMEVPEDASEKEKKDAAVSKMVFEEKSADYLSYTKGEARSYQKLIEVQKSTPDQILKELNLCRATPLIRVMRRILEFCKAPININDYYYQDYFNDENIEGLTFDQQLSIIWDWDDSYTKIQMDCIDDEAANIGVHPPLMHYRITPKTKHLSEEILKQYILWPSQLAELWNDYYQVVESLKPRKK